MDEADRLEQRLRVINALTKKVKLGTITQEEREKLDYLLSEGSAENFVVMVTSAVMVVLVAVVAIWWFVGASGREDARQEREAARAERKEQRIEARSSPEAKRRNAIYACQQAVIGRLLDPDSARFESDRVEEIGTDSYNVSGIVIARNRLGAMADNTYQCVTSLHDGNWHSYPVIGE